MKSQQLCYQRDFAGVVWLHLPCYRKESPDKVYKVIVTDHLYPMMENF